MLQGCGDGGKTLVSCLNGKDTRSGLLEHCWTLVSINLHHDGTKRCIFTCGIAVFSSLDKSYKMYSSYSSRHGCRRGGGGGGSIRYRTELVKVPAKACGLIVGRGGRNVKELQQISGIQQVCVNFQQGTVKIVGTESSIVLVKRRIDHAVILAVNSDGYFPERALTCLQLKNYAEIRFDRVSKSKDYVVQTEQLDIHREYFVISTTDAGVDVLLSTLSLAEHEQDADKGLVAGFNSSTYMPFFEDIIRSNLSLVSESSVCVSVGVNFGKTFVSSVPPESQGRPLTLTQVLALGYGKAGLRPEFVPFFTLDKRQWLLNTIEGDYVDLYSGKFIVVHCVSQKTKKRYKIKLRVSDDEAGNVAAGSDVIRKIAAADTCFAVLGIPPSATPREVKIAYRRRAVQVHPDKNSDAFAGKAMMVLNEAWETLKDDVARATYERLPTNKQRPKNSFKYSTSKAAPFPGVESFRSAGRKLALCTALREASLSEFRTTVETEKNEAMDQSMLRKLQEAWDKRSEDGRMCFPDGTDDWLIVETVKHKETVKLTNGSFILAINEVTEDRLRNSCNGLSISLESCDVTDTLKSLHNAADREGAASRLLAYIRDLQDEALRISSLLDE